MSVADTNNKNSIILMTMPLLWGRLCMNLLLVTLLNLNMEPGSAHQAHVAAVSVQNLILSTVEHHLNQDIC